MYVYDLPSITVVQSRKALTHSKDDTIPNECHHVKRLRPHPQTKFAVLKLIGSEDQSTKGDERIRRDSSYSHPPTSVFTRQITRS